MKKILLGLLLLTACDREEKPQAPTPTEAARLDEAEQMLDNMESSRPVTPEPEARQP